MKNLLTSANVVRLRTMLRRNVRREKQLLSASTAPEMARTLLIFFLDCLEIGGIGNLENEVHYEVVRASDEDVRSTYRS